MALSGLAGSRHGVRAPARPFCNRTPHSRLRCRANQPSRPEQPQVENGSGRPEDATLEMLTLLRKADATLIQPWVARVEPCSTYRVLSVGGYAVHERSPFISYSQVMDAAARRVLPGHLLRRCQVLSSFTLGDTCQQRVSITGCSGEQSVFSWVMKQQAGPEGRERRWVVQSIRRDPLQDDDPDNAASRPHPRLSPEAVIKAQLAMLQQGDVTGAARFNLWGRATSSGGSEVHQDEFRALLRQDPYHQLLTHSYSCMGPAALPTPHHFVQEVEVVLPPTLTRAEAAVCLVWDLRLQGNGCWATCGIRPSIV